jgi:hypothetical protein
MQGRNELSLFGQPLGTATATQELSLLQGASPAAVHFDAQL